MPSEDLLACMAGGGGDDKTGFTFIMGCDDMECLR
jgi:hypothetical protein